MNLWASLYVVCQKLYLFMNSPTHKLGKRFKRERERHELHKEKKNDSHTWTFENTDFKSRKKNSKTDLWYMACDTKPKTPIVSSFFKATMILFKTHSSNEMSHTYLISTAPKLRDLIPPCWRSPRNGEVHPSPMTIVYW